MDMDLPYVLLVWGILGGSEVVKVMKCCRRKVLLSRTFAALAHFADAAGTGCEPSERKPAAADKGIKQALERVF